MPLTASSRFEALDTITLTTKNQSYTLPGQGGLLDNAFFYYRLDLRFRGRMTNPSAPNAPTAILADDMFGLVERIQVKGFHTLRQSNELFIDLRGADLREYARYYANGASLQKTPTTLSIVADATNDFDFTIPVYFTPPQVPLGETVNWLLDAPNYNTLQLVVQWADENSVFSGQGAAITFSAFGATTGSPTCEVSREIALDDNKFAGLIPARQWLYMSTLTTQVQTTGNQQRLWSIPRGNRMRSIIMKLGTLATSTSPGNTAFATLSNTILTNLYLYRGTNKLIRRAYRYTDLQQKANLDFGLPATFTAGYAPWEFAPSGTLQEVFDLTGLIVGGDGDIDTFVQADVVGAANQAAMAIYSELRSLPAGVRLGA